MPRFDAGLPDGAFVRREFLDYQKFDKALRDAQTAEKHQLTRSINSAGQVATSLSSTAGIKHVVTRLVTLSKDPQTRKETAIYAADSIMRHCSNSAKEDLLGRYQKHLTPHLCNIFKRALRIEATRTPLAEKFLNKIIAKWREKGWFGNKELDAITEYIHKSSPALKSKIEEAMAAKIEHLDANDMDDAPGTTIRWGATAKAGCPPTPIQPRYLGAPATPINAIPTGERMAPKVETVRIPNGGTIKGNLAVLNSVPGTPGVSAVPSTPRHGMVPSTPVPGRVPSTPGAREDLRGNIVPSTPAPAAMASPFTPAPQMNRAPAVPFTPGAIGSQPMTPGAAVPFTPGFQPVSHQPMTPGNIIQPFTPGAAAPFTPGAMMQPFTPGRPQGGAVQPFTPFPGAAPGTPGAAQPFTPGVAAAGTPRPGMGVPGTPGAQPFTPAPGAAPSTPAGAVPGTPGFMPVPGGAAAPVTPAPGMKLGPPAAGTPGMAVPQTPGAFRPVTGGEAAPMTPAFPMSASRPAVSTTKLESKDELNRDAPVEAEGHASAVQPLPVGASSEDATAPQEGLPQKPMDPANKPQQPEQKDDQVAPALEAAVPDVEEPSPTSDAAPHPLKTNRGAPGDVDNLPVPSESIEPTVEAEESGAVSAPMADPGINVGESTTEATKRSSPKSDDEKDGDQPMAPSAKRRKTQEEPLEGPTASLTEPPTEALTQQMVLPIAEQTDSQAQ